MQIFRAYFTPREKARTIFRALFFERITFQAWLWRLPSCRVFQSQHVHVQYRKYRKRQKSHFSLSFVWIEYDLNLSYANF